MKNTTKLLVVILIISLIIPIVSLAINSENEAENKKFFRSNKIQGCQGENVTLTIDLNLITYEKFKFSLNSNMELKDITTTNSSNIGINTQANQLTIIANKEEISLNEISLAYKIPEDVKIGDKIILEGTIKEYQDENEQHNDTDIQEEKIIIEIVEKQEEPAESEKKNEPNQEQQPTTENKQQEQNNSIVKKQENTQNQIQVNKKSTINMSNNVQTKQETNVYKGDSNNYLSKLTVKGHKLLPNFSKTTTTYVINVDEDVEKLTVTATAEDDGATVNIYGNTNLDKKENKILITVTAENGDVRNYRIYVIK